MSRHHRGLTGVLLAALLVASGCSGSEPSPARNTHRAPDDITSYVALGDSFSSGPGLAPQQADAGPCLRSTRNYPALLARKLGLDAVDDVSCAGATTGHIVHDVPVLNSPVVPAQKDALSRDTDLVTIGIGYNNEQMITKLLNACLRSRRVAEAACEKYVDSALPKDMSTVQSDVVDALTEVRERAPHATVVLVGYLPIAAEPDTCRTAMFTTDQVRRVYDAERSIDTMLRDAASQAGTDFVSMRTLATGHGACDGAAAWVNGESPAKGDGAIVHPRAAGMAAVASAVAEHLRTYDK